MKRFIWNNHTIAIEDNQTKKHYYTDITCIDELIELLNELHEGTQAQVIIIKEYQKRCDKLFGENQQLKYIIKEAYNTERTALGKSVLKQLMERVGIE